jgi:vesicular inhibitory amino acid transporter
MIRIIEKDRRLRNFTQVIGFGLGPTGEKVVTALFLAEFSLWM